MNMLKNGVIFAKVTTNSAPWAEKKEEMMACDAIKYILNNEEAQDVAA